MSATARETSSIPCRPPREGEADVLRRLPLVEAVPDCEALKHRHACSDIDDIGNGQGPQRTKDICHSRGLLRSLTMIVKTIYNAIAADMTNPARPSTRQ